MNYTGRAPSSWTDRLAYSCHYEFLGLWGEMGVVLGDICFPGRDTAGGYLSLWYFELYS